MLSLYVIFVSNLCISENKEYTVVTKRLFCFLTFVSKCIFHERNLSISIYKYPEL